MKDLLKQLLDLMPLADDATPGLWQVSSHEDEYPEVFGPHGDTIHQCITGIHDAAFTAAARNLLTPQNLKHLYGCVKVLENVRPNV